MTGCGCWQVTREVVVAAYVEHGLAYLKHQQASTNGFESDDEGNRVAPPANPYTDAVGKTTLWKMLRGDARFCMSRYWPWWTSVMCMMQRGTLL